MEETEEESVLLRFPPGWLATAVLLVDIVYIWGGYPYSNVLCAFEVDNLTWSKPNVYGTIPEARQFHSACLLEKVMYIYGGLTQLTRHTNGIYKLDTTTMVWSLINTWGTPPPVSECHSATIIGTKMFVFGGSVREEIYNNITVFDTKTNHWLTHSGHQLLPEQRCHSAFVNNGELYILGGWHEDNSFKEMWKFSPETFSWKRFERNGKPHEGWDEGMKAGMCCYMVGDRIFNFGGYTYSVEVYMGGRIFNVGGHTSDDVYILDLNPSLKMLCKLAVIQHGLEQLELPHNIRWELAANNTGSVRQLKKHVIYIYR